VQRIFAILMLVLGTLIAIAMGGSKTTRASFNEQQLAASLGVDSQVLYEDLVAIKDDVSRLQEQF